METHSSAHVYLEWVKGRLDEIDTTLASLESRDRKSVV